MKNMQGKLSSDCLMKMANDRKCNNVHTFLCWPDNPLLLSWKVNISDRTTFISQKVRHLPGHMQECEYTMDHMR